MPTLINLTQIKIKLRSFLPGLIHLESSSHTFFRFLLIQICKILHFFCKPLTSDCAGIPEAYWSLPIVTDLVATGQRMGQRRSTGIPFQGTTPWSPSKTERKKLSGVCGFTTLGFIQIHSDVPNFLFPSPTVSQIMP